MVDYITITVLLAVAVAAQFVSLRFGVAVAIIELLLGIFLGNWLGIRASDREWPPVPGRHRRGHPHLPGRR